jgi:protein TonB
MTLELSSTVVTSLALGVALLTFVFILLGRVFFKKQSEINLTERHLNEKAKYSLTGRVKYPEVDVFSMRGTFLNFGLLAAIGLMILAFSWTTFDEKVDLSSLLGTVADEIEMETPRTAEPPPPPPPPPAPTTMQIVETDLTDLETIEFEDMSITEETVIDAPKPVEKAAAAPPPPPPPPKMEENEREIFKVVEENPTFPGCEEVANMNERRTCAEEKMMRFIHESIKYPTAARDNGIAGMVVVQFVVEKDGSITNVKILRDIGGGCGDEAVRVVNSMPIWNPGKQRGRPVRVMFTLPVKFVLA